MDLHWNVLDQKRRKLLPALAPWKREGLYLAGGTALALRLGHRTSLDFDFYSTEDFDPLRLAGKLSLPPGGFKISTQKPGTLLGRAGGVHLSAFHYPYRLLKPATETPSFLVASLEDIAAMKLIAVAQRGTRRDFTDLYFLCRLSIWRRSFPSPERNTRHSMFTRDSGVSSILRRPSGSLRARECAS